MLPLAVGIGSLTLTLVYSCGEWDLGAAADILNKP
jgi:hypothetical protein